ncbi:MAG: phospholipase [Deltaproteobacteria bacterium]|nr:phospholipase [Deltaproteobacteria bacterium]
MNTVEIAGLTTHIAGAADAPNTVVLLHGFGAPGDDLVVLADHIRAGARWFFPEAPLELGGLYGDSRAWWLLDLAALEADLRTGVPRDRRAELPEGLHAARAQLLRFLDELEAQHGVAPDRLVLGGFSQGAMLSLDVALHRERTPPRLLLMSGTLLAESDWQPRWPRLARSKVLLSHGRADGLLPFGVAEALRDRLRDAGATVDWHPFDGGHEIPSAVVAAAGPFLGDVG